MIFFYLVDLSFCADTMTSFGIKMFRLLLNLLLIVPFTVHSARILGIFPAPSISHQVVFRALTTELARRGHELVVVTPDPEWPKPKQSPRNITEIDVSFSYEALRRLFTDNTAMLKRGVILSQDEHITASFNRGFRDVLVDIVDHPDLQKILTDKNQHFDLVISEAYMNYHHVVSKILNAPLILFSSLYGLPESFEAVGAVARHPILYPIIYREEYGRSLWDKIQHIKYEFDVYRGVKQVEKLETEALKKRFGAEAPSVEDLKEHVDLLFVNAHPIFLNNRPMSPNVVYVGPLHLKPAKGLPQELKSYLDNSKRGVIYVSLGTNVKPSNMDKGLLDAFIEVFRKLPYDVLWKFDGDHLENVSKNVRMQKWFPQRDLLVHPNIKLFVMQGGLQSTDEAIDAGVPLVGIPMLADQAYNVQKYIELGIGVKVDPMTLDSDSLLKGIKRVLNDESYWTNIKQLKAVMNDNPQTPLERAVWWTEYVIRHRGAKHLRPPAANMSWSEYLVLDVFIAVTLFVILGLILIFLTAKIAISKLFYNSPKVKKS